MNDLDSSTGNILAFAALVLFGIVTNPYFSLGVVVWALVTAFNNQTGKEKKNVNG